MGGSSARKDGTALFGDGKPSELLGMSETVISTISPVYLVGICGWSPLGIKEKRWNHF